MDADAPPLDHLDDAGLFDVVKPPPITLADKFVFPPFAFFDRRQGAWQDRRRRWLSLGITSEVGRAGQLTFKISDPEHDFAQKLMSISGGTSVFDPVVCELVYRWYSAAGDRILDPFAGGSVRGVVASTLARYYTGIELRPEQVDANREQAHLGSDITPVWITGSATDLDELLGPDAEYDLIFSCPPYADLERYSDDPADLSTMDYPDFAAAHAQVIAAAAARLRPHRFAGWVISDVRDTRGAYRGLVMDTIRAFAAAGMTLHNDVVILDPIGMGKLRAERPFRATRKLVRTHQHLLIFAKGDPRKAAARLEEAER